MKKILYFSPILWNDLKQRPQHIAEELSKYYKIYYVEPSISILNSIINKNELYKKNNIEINSNLKVIRTSGNFRLPKSFEIFDLFNLNTLYERSQLKKLIEECEIIWVGSPIFYNLIKNYNDKKIIYDKMDDYIYLTKNKFLKKLLYKNETELVKNATFIFTTCTVFYENIKQINKNVYIVNNGVDINFVNKIVHNKENQVAREIEKLKKEGKVAFGYIGTIDHWFDYEAIKKIINYNKDFHVVFVGKCNIDKINHKNVHYYEPVNKDKLPEIIESFDYCLYTFKINDFINTIDPVKVYEYLSLNQKVIAAMNDELNKFSRILNLYKNYKELHELLDNIRKIKSPFYKKQDLLEFIIENSWSGKVENIIEIINNK